MIYLASPYSHHERTIQYYRYEMAAKTTAILIEKGYPVYSPIVHGHHLAENYGLKGDFETWEQHNIALLQKADALLVLTLPGWGDSVGVQHEIRWAHTGKIPVALIEGPDHAATLPKYETWENNIYLIYPNHNKTAKP